MATAPWSAAACCRLVRRSLLRWEGEFPAWFMAGSPAAQDPAKGASSRAAGETGEAEGTANLVHSKAVEPTIVFQGLENSSDPCRLVRQVKKFYG